MKKKVLKLTPALLKRIIREEKEKLESLGLLSESNDQTKTIENKNVKAVNEMRKLRDQQRAAIRIFKKLHEKRNNIKKKILKES